MAICDVCEQEMTQADGCTASKLKFAPYVRGKNKRYCDGCGQLPECCECEQEQFNESAVTILDRIPYGQEIRPKRLEQKRCSDCAVKLGHFHHPGCDWEECPRCGLQLISCDCNEKGEFSDCVEEPANPITPTIQ
jgi:hypothetical protein